MEEQRKKIPLVLRPSNSTLFLHCLAFDLAGAKSAEKRLWETENVLSYIKNFSKNFFFCEALVLMPLVNSEFNVGIDIWMSHDLETVERVADDKIESKFPQFIKEMYLKQKKFGKIVRLLFYCEHYDLL